MFWINDLTGFFGIFWCKVLSLAITYYFINDRKKKEYYYYLNLGVSKKMLWISSVSFDFALFVISIIILFDLQ
jgi:hypothetical protein